MKKLKTLLVGAGIGTLLAVLSAAPASATPITFTWNPNATAGGTLSSPGSQFSANNLTIADYATINTANPSAVTESSILAITAFNAGVNPAGFVGGGGGGATAANIGATPYQLYFKINSTSHLSQLAPGYLVGAFDSLSYTLYGDVGGNCTFAPSGASCGTDNQLALLTGSLSNAGLNQANIINGIPSANVDATVVNGPNGGGFFVSPADLMSLLFESSFTNTPGVVTQSGSVITINGGGGNVDMVAIPEPLTLSLFGAGLVGAAALRRRRSKKA
jgi:hypothetical protein